MIMMKLFRQFVVFMINAFFVIIHQVACFQWCGGWNNGW